MKKLLPLSLIATALGIGFLSFNHKAPKNDEPEFAKPGMVAYAASYSSDPKSEPKHSTQLSTTYQYLNLGSTHDSYRGDSVKVGIIDSGINYDHEDFMVSGSTKVKGDSKYYSYQTSSWVYYKASQHGYSYIDDTLGHGTNVAATVAAAVNSVGGYGIAPNVELYVYKVTNSSNGYEFGAIQNALMDAQSLGIKVINMSFQSYEHAVSYGGSSMSASSGCSTILSYYLNQAYNAGITLVGAAGNYNTDEPSYPGSNNHVINVGSLNSTRTGKAGFSNYGSTIDLVAPGYVYVADEASNSAYTNTQGTSFSAPLVTGAIALYKQKYPSATPAEIETALYASCDPIDDSGSAYTNWAGNGALNVAKFLGVEEQEDCPTDIVINNPEIVNEELSLEVGDTFDLDWTVNGNGTFDDSVSFYTLDDNGTVSVDSNGRITALSQGSDYVIIESNADSNVYTQVYVTVTSSGSTPTVSSVSVTPSSLSLDLNGTKTGTLTATVYGSNNPAQTVNWSSSNTSVATVSASGVVTAKATGNATITATSTVDGTKSGTCTVTVTDSTVHVTGVTLNKNSTSIAKGGSETLTATVAPNNATNKNVTWTSSNTSAATVSNGVVSVPSNATIGATSTITVRTEDGSYTVTCTVTVAASTQSQTLTITINSFTNAGQSYSWYDWTQSTTDSTSISGKGEIYKQGGATAMQFNKGSGSKSGAIFNTTAIPGAITKIEATTASGTNRAWNAYVTSTACSLSGTSLVFGSNQTTVGSNVTIGTSSTTIGTSTAGYSYFCLQENVNSASYLGQIKITYTPETPKTLSGISLNTDNVTKSFKEGDTFTHSGLVVTANYSDAPSETIESGYTVSSPDMTVIGQKTITVTYKGKEATYNITVGEGTLSSIAVSGQTTSYQKNYAFSFDGVCTATFANGYQKAVTPTSVTSPDMSTAGEKTITVSVTYNGVTKTTSYTITVNSNRTVIEETSTTGYSVIGTVTYPSNTKTISVNTLSVSESGYTTIESNSVRLGSGSNTGTVTVTSTSSNITKVVVSAKSYGSDTGVTLTIGGTSNTLTSSYADYVKEYATATNSVAIATTTNKKRAHIQTITVYETKTTTVETDISNTPDCVGLETFIDTYMHMDYVDNLGYCKDSEHHYYSSAKTAFNALNTHQRTLFTTNSAYTTEWTRLSAWAAANGDSLNGSNQLEVSKTITTILNKSNDMTAILVLLAFACASTGAIYFVLRKRKHD